MVPDDAGLTQLATAITELSAPRSGARIPQSQWQRKIIEYDRDGPSIVGFYLDLRSLLVSKMDVVPQVKDGPTWGPDESSEAEDGLGELVGTKKETPQELIRLTARAIARTGEVVWVPFDDEAHPTYPSWRVAETHLMKKFGPVNEETGLPEYWDILDTPGAKPGSRHHHRVPGENPWWIVVNDPDHPAEAWSPLRRVLRDVRGYNVLDRNLSRSAMSRLTWNSILWIQGKYSDVKRKNTQGDEEWGPLGMALRDLIEAGKVNLDDYEDRNVRAAMSVPFISPNEPKLIDAARRIDTSIFLAIDFRLKAIARGLNMPAHMLLEGPGTANRWNDVFLDDSLKETSVLPLANQTYAAVTEVFWARKMKNRGLDPTKRRLWYNLPDLAQKMDNVKEIGDAVNAGVLEPIAWAIALGLEEYLLKPPGPEQPKTPEYEHWERAFSNKSGAGIKDSAGGTGVQLPRVAQVQVPEWFGEG